MPVGPEEETEHTSGEACNRIAPLVGLPEGTPFPYLIIVERPDGQGLAIASNVSKAGQDWLARTYVQIHQEDRIDKSGLN